jgi:hypothetical protein
MHRSQWVSSATLPTADTGSYGVSDLVVLSTVYPSVGHRSARQQR